MNPFQSVWAIASNTFRETVRDRVLYAFIVFAIIVTLAGILLGTLSVEQNVRVLEDIGMFTISTIGGVIAIFVGTNLVYKELDKRTIYLIFTKPIKRWQFIFGKFMGLSLCILVVTLLMGGFLVGVAMLQGEKNPQFILASLGLLYIELLLVIALACFFSTFATPLMSVIFTLALWLCGHLGQSLLSLSNMSASPTVKSIFQAVYHVLPDLAKLTEMRFELVSKAQLFEPMQVTVVVAYVCAYIMLLLSVATFITERREFS